MYQAIQWSRTTGLVNQNEPKGNMTPGDIGEILFHHVLERMGQTSYAEDTGLSSYPTTGSNRKPIQKEQEGDISPLLQLNEKIRQLGVPTSHLVLPESAIPLLRFFLKNHGLDEEQINQLIQTAGLSDGSLRVDPFLPYFMKQGQGAGNRNLVIQSQDTPRLEELLFRMGFGVGEIKEIMEKGARADGDMDLGQISTALSKYRGVHSEQDLISLLHDFDITGKPKIMDTVSMDPELKKELSHLSQTPSADMQQTIKRNISALLIQKGIPPQEVKSFVEGLSIQYAKTTLKAAATQGLESNDVLNQVTVSNQSVWEKGGWDEKILAILQGERVLAGRPKGRGNGT